MNWMLKIYLLSAAFNLFCMYIEADSLKTKIGDKYQPWQVMLAAGIFSFCPVINTWIAFKGAVWYILKFIRKNL